jgi:hypothetical protein
MGTGQKSNRVLVPEAAQALNNFKYEIANELGVGQQIQGGYWGDVPSRDAGAVGGNMVRKMIAFAESQMQNSTQPVSSQPLSGNSNSKKK